MRCSCGAAGPIMCWAWRKFCGSRTRRRLGKTHRDETRRRRARYNLGNPAKTEVPVPEALLDLEALLAPIPGDSPTGTNLYGSPLFDKVNELRTTDDPEGMVGTLRESGRASCRERG